MAEVVGNPPSLSKRLTKQWRLVAIGVAIVAAMVVFKNADLDATPTGDTCRIEVTADVLNVRAGPGADFPLVEKLGRGDEVEATSETANGFRSLGENRWVATEFVTTHGKC